MPTNELDGPELDDSQFSANMQRLRERSGMSQSDLVRVLRNNGWKTVHQTTISRIEKGERPARLGEARAIARAFNVSLNLFMLTPAESKDAARIAYRVQRVRNQGKAVTRAVADLLQARDELKAIVDRSIAEGMVPTPQPGLPDYYDDWEELVSSGRAEDELAIAQQVLATDPIGQFKLAKLLHARTRPDVADA